MRYTQGHFDEEELLMVRYAYPELSRHQQIHADLLLEIDNIRARMTQGAELVALQALKDWFVHHVQTADRALGEYLQRCASAENSALFAIDAERATRH